MPTVTMHDAKTNLSRYVASVERGEVGRVVIARGSVPVAMLVPYERDASPRPIGFMARDYDLAGDIDAHDAEVAALMLGEA